MNKENSKYCRSCHDIKLKTEFNKDICQPSGLSPWCKPCIKVKNAKIYQKRKIKNMETSNLDKMAVT